MLWKKDIAKLNKAIQSLSTTRSTRKQAMARDERVKKVLEDPALQKALAEGDFRAIVKSPQLISLLTDAAAVEQLLKAGLEHDKGSVAKRVG